jgi:hypothetical protein
VQRSVDRRFNRVRYDAEQTIATFAARLKDAVDLDSVQNDLTGVMHQGPGTRPRLGVDQPPRLNLASASSTAAKPGPSNKVRHRSTRSSALTCTSNPHDHELQLP